jgi:predicted lipoprotein with Yx(FWY)xxD motif
MSIKIFALILALAALMTAIIAVAEKESYAVDMVSSEQYGDYLTNKTFFTLYRYLSDPQDQKMSTCNGNCAKIWPAFYVEDLTMDPELRPIDFDTITREDGSKQLTYKGWPLYLYSGDTKSFETNGQGVNGLWFVVQPMNLTR